MGPFRSWADARDSLEVKVKMQIVKYGLRFLVALGSVLGFFGGWVLLAHAEKPAVPAAPAPVVAPAPVILPTPAPFFSAPNSALQPLPSSPRFSTMPRMRTRGS